MKILSNPLHARNVLVATLLLATNGCEAPIDPLTTVEEYVQRANEHDVEMVVDMFAPDARLDFGPIGVVEGRLQIRNIHEYDRALNTRITLRECAVGGLEVVCRTTETNYWLDIAEIGEIEFTQTTFKFTEEGLIAGIAAELSPESATAMSEALVSFDAWARSQQPNEYAHLFNDDGGFNYGFASGERVLALLRNWREKPEPER